MITLRYEDETKREIVYNLSDWDAVMNVAQALCNAPIDLEYVYYVDGNEQGVFNLTTFEKC